MSLIQEINRTETEKNKTKQVAVNIDNKLVELGGEQATDLADVPNRIDALILQYSKYAEIKIDKFEVSGVPRANRKTINLNLNFEPKEIFVGITSLIKKRALEYDEYSNSNCGFYLDTTPKTFQYFRNGSASLIFDVNADFNKDKLNLTIRPSRDEGANSYIFNFDKIYVWGD